MKYGGVKKWLAICAALLCIAAAPDPADVLKDPAQEARAREMFHQIRCVVCQNESIDDSQAELAHDLRQVVRAQVAAGKSDAEIKTFLVSKYGDFILLKPRLNASTVILWIAPFTIVIVGLGILLARRRRTEEAATELSADEEARLKSLIEQPPET